MKIMKSVGESIVSTDHFPALVLLASRPFLFSRFFKNHMSLALIRRSTKFPREVVEADGSVAICLGLHFSFFVDWYHRG